MTASSNARTTKQRNAVRVTLEAADRPLLAQEVLERAKLEVPGLGIATVYRSLKAMIEDGTLLQVLLPGENPRYEVVGKGHHHHFHCLSCGRVFDVHACPKNLDSVTPRGFTLERHDLTLYWRCSSCPAP
jgi:Fur family ferric uptake transcriptional regulator